MSRLIYKLTLIIVMTTLTVGLSSCGTSKKTPSRSYASSKTGHATAVPQRIDLSETDSPVTGALLREAMTWLGTPYRYGGNDRSGVDCSGFVLQVYKKAVELKLPRTSTQQHQYCSTLDRSQLERGDLVFFSTNGTSSVGHVGIYVGNGNFIHASSSRGVIISSLDATYYAKNYFGAGRIDRFYALVNESRSTISAPNTDTLIASATTPQSASEEQRPTPEEQPLASNSTNIKPVRIAKMTTRTPDTKQTSPIGGITAKPPTTPDTEAGSGLESLSEFFD